jgi:hypothetical protein
MTSTLTYLVPTRGRPANAVRLARAFHETCRGDDTRLQFFVDDDDPERQNYLDMLYATGMDHVSFGVLVGPRLRLGGTLNAHAVGHAKLADAVGFMGDDHVPRTVGWDVELLSEVQRVPGAVVYGDDLLQRQALPTAVLLDSRVVRALGFMAPPGLVHLYLDNFWRDLGLGLGTLRYRPDVVVEHLHPVNGKAEWDDRYAEVNDGSVYAADEETYRTFCVDGGMRSALQRVREVLA